LNREEEGERQQQWRRRRRKEISRNFSPFSEKNPFLSLSLSLASSQQSNAETEKLPQQGCQISANSKRNQIYHGESATGATVNNNCCSIIDFLFYIIICAPFGACAAAAAAKRAIKLLSQKEKDISFQVWVKSDGQQKKERKETLQMNKI
jgi:hypothetical protein